MTPDDDILQEDFTLLLHPPPPAQTRLEGMHDAYSLGAASLLLVLIAAWVWRRWRARQARLRAREPPDRVALRELRAWLDVEDAARSREAIAAMSGTMRRYIEARFQLRAPVLTTAEFRAEQVAQPRIPQSDEPFCLEFLELCDLIKYAGLKPGRDQLGALLEAAIEFVVRSRSHGSTASS